MSDTQHPITPPPELVQQWDREWREQQNAPVIGWSANLLAYVAARAAQWSADQELEACKQVILDMGWFAGPHFRLHQLQAARRPKPPSLKEQALQAHERCAFAKLGDRDTIRRALEQLSDD